MSDPGYEEVPSTTVTIPAEEADDPDALEEVRAALTVAARKATEGGRVISFIINVVP